MPRRTLDWDKVHEIRAKARGGAQLMTLAEEYGVNFGSIGKVVRNKLWHDPDYTPGVEKECRRRDCHERFVTLQTTNVFCSERCSSMEHNRIRVGYYDRQPDGEVTMTCSLVECDREFPTYRAAVRRFCSTEHQRLHTKRVRQGYYDRRAAKAEAAAQEKRDKVLARVSKGALWSPWRLDQPVGTDDGSATLADLVEAPGGVDPLAELELAEVRRLLDGLEIEDVQTLPVDRLAVLRSQIRAAGFAPSVRVSDRLALVTA